MTLLSVEVEAVFWLPAASIALSWPIDARDRAGARQPGDRDVVDARAAGDRADLRARRRPPIVTSPATKPVTGSLKVAVKLIGCWFVGSFWPAAWLTVTLGLTVSTVNVFAC